MPHRPRPEIDAIDARYPSRAVAEVLNSDLRLHVPADASRQTAIDTKRRAQVFLPWLYDADYGWTPGRERLEPRPALQLAPYYQGSFPLRTSTLPGQHRNTITIDLRGFPRAAKVYLMVPTKLLDPELRRRSRASRRARIGHHVALAKHIGVFNLISGQHLRGALGRTTTVLELTSGVRCVWPMVKLDTTQEVVVMYYAMARDAVQPKTYYNTLFSQYIDNKLMGKFEHAVQAYHQYDAPIIADRRTMLAYRRSSKEVSTIPPLAIGYFDDWLQARAAGFDAAPRSFGRHYGLQMITATTLKLILRFFNKKTLKATAIVRKIKDNPYVDAFGRRQAIAEQKRGIDLKTAERLLQTRNKLPKRRFSNAVEIDEVKGVGPDTFSDIVTTFIDAEARRPQGGLRRWLPDSRLTRVLNRRRG